MASVRLNLFKNIPNIHLVSLGVPNNNWQSLKIQGVYIPGSISFNSVAIILSKSGSSATLSGSFGLYSLTGSTLSLANSASFAANSSTSFFSWLSLATSATQNITPGNWYLGFVFSTAGHSSFSILHNWTASGLEGAAGAQYGGGLVRGYYSTTTGALPNSMNTSEFTKEGNISNAGSTLAYSYILISA